MKSSVILIGNPVAGKRASKKIKEAAMLLEKNGFDVRVSITKKSGDAERLAREAVKDNPSIVFAAGGDGTINEVINGLAGKDIPVAIIPLGTTNVLAKELGISGNIKKAISTAIRGIPHYITLGKINSRYFSLMAGIGFDGKTVYQVNKGLKRHTGKLAYALSAINALMKYKPEPLKIKVDGETTTCYNAIVGNAKNYGGYFRFTPHADIIEPSLDICLMKGKSKLRLIKYLLLSIRGMHINLKDIEYRKNVRGIEITGNGHIQVDGDYFGILPAKISVVPDAIKLIW